MLGRKLVVVAAVGTMAVGAQACGGEERGATLQGKVGAMTTTVAQAPAKALATVEGSVDGATLDLLSVRRSGKVVTAQFRLKTAEHGTFEPELLSEDGEQADLSGARLVDDVNVREYAPLRNGKGGCICTNPVGDGDEIGWDESVALSAKFPAPPGDVREISLVVPTFASFDGIVLG
jgi:hypothetical protein